MWLHKLASRHPTSPHGRERELGCADAGTEPGHPAARGPRGRAEVHGPTWYCCPRSRRPCGCPDRATEQLPLFSAGESSSFLDKYPLRFSSGNIIVCSLTEKKGSATQCQGTLLHSGGLLTHPSPSYLSFYRCVDLSSGMFHPLCHFLTANCVRRPLKGRDFVSFFTRLI